MAKKDNLKIEKIKAQVAMFQSEFERNRKLESRTSLSCGHQRVSKILRFKIALTNTCAEKTCYQQKELKAERKRTGNENWNKIQNFMETNKKDLQQMKREMCWRQSRII